MPKGVIDFHYDSGKQYCKKRKRLPGTNPDKKPEIKQFNPKDGLGTFDGISFMGLTKMTSDTVWLPWRLMPLSWPPIGTSANERIGNSMFLKAIRFKGYIDISRNVLRPIRWRLRIFRFEKPFPDFKSAGTYTEQTDAYLNLYKNTEQFAQGASAAQITNRSVHNFYKMIKDMPKPRPYTSKVLATGVIPANNQIITKGTFQYGQTNSFHVGAEIASPNYESGYFPVDVLVKCNDRITWSLDDAQSAYTPDIRYCLVLEDDFGMGVYIQEAKYIAGQTPTTEIPSIAFVGDYSPCYYLRLNSRAYFTDD